MQTWIVVDDAGTESLLRAGAGRVTAVVPVGDPHDATLVYRIEIDCDRPAGRPRAVRYRVHGLVQADDPLVVHALDASAAGAHVRWTIAWRRLPWVPDHLPMGSLDLATDARAEVQALVVEPEVDPAVEPLADRIAPSHGGHPSQGSHSDS